MKLTGFRVPNDTIDGKERRMESHSFIDSFVDELVKVCPDIGTSFKTQMPMLVTIEGERPPRRLIKVKYTQGKSTSLRSANAFLEWRRFIKFVTEQVIDGASAYMVPKLCIPIAMRMLCAANNIVSVEIGPTGTGIILALYLKSLESSGGITNEQLEKDTKDLLKRRPFEVSFKKTEFRDALKLLVQVKAIQQIDSLKWLLVDKVKITA